MRDQLFVEGPGARDKLSRFWLLLILAAIIASAGVVGDSTATVIGAMIVAPLMTPILAIVLAVVLNERRNLLRSIALVVTGSLAVVAVGWLLGLARAAPIVAATNSQVASRISPNLIDLLAALATGAVGSIALIREDISDTLPGVAIAISLVPPLCVVGLTLESGAPTEARGAMLLFLTNVSAILASGLVIMASYGLFSPAAPLPAGTGRRMQQTPWVRPGVLVIVVLVVLFAAPLTATSVGIARQRSTQTRLTDVADSWASHAGWSVDTVSPGANSFVVRAVGLPPLPNSATLRKALDDAGLASTTVDLELIPEKHVRLPADPH